MGDQEASLIDHKHGGHLLLDQPLLRLPLELLKNHFRSARYSYEKESTFVNNLLKETGTSAVNGKASPEDVIKNLDAMLARMRGVKRKLATHASEEARIYHQVNARVRHMRELSDMHTVEDVKYETWSRQRLDRLLVDYLLRKGFDKTATALADERSIQDLVDVDTFVAASKIRESLLHKSVQEALAWCSENKKELRKMDSNLEFMLRCQQFVEMIRTDETSRLTDAILHARRFIVPYQAAYPDDVHQIAGLLAYRAGTDLEPYASWFSPRRWRYLADLFVRTHNTLLGLPPFPLLHTALSLGLSVLKTPACHSATNPQHQQSTDVSVHATTSLSASVCPICSTELNELARHVPYAHHSKSHVEHDLLLLPNGRVYGKARLEEYATKAGLAPGTVKDLVTGDLFTWDQLKKVYIT